eukprot:163696_1
MLLIMVRCTFFLIYLLINNIAEIVISAYQITVLQDPPKTHMICGIPSDGGPEECYDEREYYESYGLNVTFLSVVIGFCSIHLIVNIAGFHALQACVSTIFFMEWLLLNIQIVFILVHSITAGIYYGVFAMLLLMCLSCYFWMLYQLSKYFKKGGVYDGDMNYMSPSPNNYAVMYVAKPDELANYHEHYTKYDKPNPMEYKELFYYKMHEQFDTCCCQCNLMTWSIVWIIYMLFQNSIWLISAVMCTIVLYDDYGEWTDCVAIGDYEGEEGTSGGGITSTLAAETDCRVLFEDRGLTKGFAVTCCIVAGICLIVNAWCLQGLYECNKSAIMGQVWMLLIQ